MRDRPVPQPEVARYRAPRVAVSPVVEVLPSEAVDAARPAGRYQHVLLDIGTGELSFHENPQHRERWDLRWRSPLDVPRETWERWYPGEPFWLGLGPQMWSAPVPRLLSWVVDCGSPGHPYLDVEAADAVLESVRPYAQELLDGLFEVGGELEWSAASVRAGRQVCRLTSRGRDAASPVVDGDLVDFAGVVARCPQVYHPELLSLPLDELAEECAALTVDRFEHSHPEVKKVLGMPYADGSGVGLEVLGVRSWYSTVAMG